MLLLIVVVVISDEAIAHTQTHTPKPTNNEMVQIDNWSSSCKCDVN